MLTVKELNNLANHPAVAPHIAPGYEKLDLSAAYNKPDTTIGGNELGAILLANMGNGVYCWHWLLSPAVRGAKALQLARNVITEAFTNPKVQAIAGNTPRTNRAARLMNRALGARPIGESIDAYGRECINYILEREAWETSLAASSEASAHS